MKNEKQINQTEMLDDEQDYTGITFFDVLGVLFGRKLLLLIVTASLFLASTIGILLYNKSKSTYVGFYEYYVSGLADGRYVDGSRFDVRDLITLEKLKQYQSEHEELAKLNVENVYYNGVIRSIEREITYREDKEKSTEENPVYVIAKDGYKIVLAKNAISAKEAKVLVKAIADEANIISQSIVDNADYSQFLTLYNQSNNYDQQLDYLSKQYEKIFNNYSNLIDQYGDVIVKDSLKLSDIRLQMQEYFQKITFNSLKQELDFNGYVKDFNQYEMILLKQKEALSREKDVANLKKQELIAQRDALLGAAGQLQTLELSAYNEEIIELTNRIFDIDEEIAIIQLKLDNKNRTDADYLESKAEFEAKLSNHCAKLREFTNEYTNYEKEIVKKYSIVYFDSNAIVSSRDGINKFMYIGIAAVGSFVIALIVNLCLDGKKLSKKAKIEKSETK